MPQGFNTRSIHAGQTSDPTTGAVVPPIYLSSTFEQEVAGTPLNGFEYSRCDNPTRTALQENLTSLEGGLLSYSFASGMAAEDAFFRAVLKPGDHIVLGNDAYGGSYRAIEQVYGPWGVTNSCIDFTDLTSVEEIIKTTKPRVVRIETPTNPMMTIVDIEGVSKIAHKHGALVLVDNTFATPALQRPFELGADVVLHSTTKYLGGHSDVVGGALVLKDAALAEKVAQIQNWLGAISSPFDAYLTLRGIKTLGVRMERHSSNAMALAERFENHKAVERVLYPGLESHPGHDVAKRQMSLFGGMMSIQLAGGEKAATALTTRTNLFILAPSLGGVESLIEHPGLMTHHSVEGTALEVPSNLVRISVGIEDIDDLIEDLAQALDSLL
ncbi:cystathionine gamma-synthase [uncultured Aurantimicrobium sp.]|mgnify:FL=1|uniref:cystathionine gamma-synthase n=1 Tax=uncultured Aurantimicrobium sp. TaxID=1705357 RepID=UPI00263028A0|nr:cystathionine gamma-synthase [uncultured Aurantimicrobium sp.]